MLSKLFGSNARVMLLKLFLFNPEEKLYLREISRRLGLAVNSVSRELDNLEALGLLSSALETVDISPAPSKEQDEETEPEEKAKRPVDSAGKKKEPAPRAFTGFLKQQRKYYRVNPAFPIFDEVKNLVIRSQVLYEKDFSDKVKKIGRLHLLILSGLFAGNPGSPVDVLIVGKINKAKLMELIKEMEKELMKELNFTLMDPEEFKYRKDMTDVFLYSILEGKKIILVDEIGLY